ncbi:MAG: AMP-binding protein, partial [Actinobacteria bacterium]|nr:AMP-binding protein [Actinomycetota bacterium]
MTDAGWRLRDARAVLGGEDVEAVVEPLVRALAAADLGPERRVAVFADNAVETLLAHLAALRAGCSAVPVNARLTTD